MASMAASDSHAPSNSYFLSGPPGDNPPPAVTQGTDIPAPSDSPNPKLRNHPSRPRLSRPPTSGGGPLSSHPTDDPIPGLWPPLSEAELDLRHSKASTDSTRNSRTRADSFTSPASPPTAPAMYPSPAQQRPRTVRRLLSLSSLRQSFSSSRTSLGQRPDTSHGSYQAPYSSSNSYRAESPTLTSTTASMAPPASARLSNEGRPSTTLRKKRSSSWFKRKSNVFGMMNEDDTLDVLNEDGPEHKRFKDHQLPTLPEIGALSGGSLDGGSIGWDDQLFQRRYEQPRIDSH